jgi:hypothetical protein
MKDKAIIKLLEQIKEMKVLLQYTKLSRIDDMDMHTRDDLIFNIELNTARGDLAVLAYKNIEPLLEFVDDLVQTYNISGDLPAPYPMLTREDDNAKH